jgi:hypothetical protein
MMLRKREAFNYNALKQIADDTSTTASELSMASDYIAAYEALSRVRELLAKHQWARSLSAPVVAACRLRRKERKDE